MFFYSNEFFIFSFGYRQGTILLVRIAGDNLAESVSESEGERCEQLAFGQQKFTPNC
jgi:hypothetical protein